MKKMKLAVIHGIGKELTRDELKNIFGGSDPGSSGNDCLASCSISHKCPDNKTEVSCNGDCVCVKVYNQSNAVIGVRCDLKASALC